MIFRVCTTLDMVSARLVLINWIDVVKTLRNVPVSIVSSVLELHSLFPWSASDVFDYLYAVVSCSLMLQSV